MALQPGLCWTWLEIWKTGFLETRLNYFYFSNIYWTDVRLKLISVAMGDGRYARILIRDDLEEPLAIAVNPKRG